MLSFYQFDRMLRKQQKGQRAYAEALSDELRAKIAALHGRLSGGQKKPVTVDPPVAEEPPAPPAPPAVKPATQVQAPPAVGEPPAPPAPTPAAAGEKGGVDDLLSQLMTQMGGSKAPSPKAAARGHRRSVGGRATGAQRPAVITKTKDINDPDSPEMQALKAGEEVPGMRLGKGRGVTKRLQDQGKGPADRLADWNNYMNSKTYSYYTAVALQKMGVKVPPEYLNKEAPQPFAVALAKGTSGQDRRPELVVPDSKLLFRAIRAANNMISVARERDPIAAEPRMNDFDRALFSKATKGGDEKLLTRSLAAGMGLNMEDDPEFNVARRAREFSKLFRHHKYTSQGPMTILDLAKQLGAEAPALAGGIGSKPDAILDLQAVVHMVKTDMEGKYHNFSISGGRGKIGPDTVIQVNSGADLGKDTGTDPLLTGAPTAAMPGQGGGGAPEKDVAGHLRSKLAQRRALRKQKHGPPTPQAEAQQWMDMMNLMEHWGF